MFALVAGLLFGLLGLPTGGAWLGLLWPWVFLKAFKKPRAKLVCFFVFGLGQTQLCWIFPVIKQQYSFGVALLWFETAVLSVYVSLGLLLTLWVWACQQQRKWPPATLFWVGFGPVFLGFLELSDFFPFAGVPSPSFASQPWVMDSLGGSYRLIGAKGVLSLLSLAALCLATVNRKRSLAPGLYGFFLLAGLLGSAQIRPPAPHGPQLNVAYLPWSGTLGTHPTRKQALQDLATRTAATQKLPVNLLVWPESAVPGLAETGRDLERLAALIQPKQALLLGGNHREQEGGQFHDYNSAYLLKGAPFRFELYKKQYLVPFAEANPGWAKSLPLFLPRTVSYQPGGAVIFKLHGFDLAPGIGFEQYLDRWFREREAQADGYVFLSSEGRFSWFGKQVLANLGRAKALQTDKPVLKVANGALSGLTSPTHLNQTTGNWHPKLKAGEITLTGHRAPSPFYQRGPWAVLALVIFFSSGLAVLVKPRHLTSG